MAKKRTKKKSDKIGWHPTVYQHEFTGLEIDLADALLLNNTNTIKKIFKGLERLMHEIQKDPSLKNEEREMLGMRCDTLLCLLDSILMRIAEIQKFQRQSSLVEKKNIMETNGKTQSYIT